jgi:hypothetical protein
MNDMRNYGTFPVRSPRSGQPCQLSASPPHRADYCAPEARLSGFSAFRRVSGHERPLLLKSSSLPCSSDSSVFGAPGKRGLLRPHPAESGSASGKLTIALSVLAASIPLYVLRDFMVDDALVTARIAHHLATGIGYRFNTHGPVVDAVTPLGFAHALAPFGRAGPLQAYRAAKWLGALAWLVSAGLLGHWVSGLGKRPARYLPLSVLVCSAPLAAWAASGMETGLVTLLCTLALAQTRWAALAAGMAAGLRPELIPWAVVLSFGASKAQNERLGAVSAALTLAVVPAIAAGAVRALAFGHAAPLAVLAKPSDLEHGFVYAAFALVGTAVLPLDLAGRAYFRVDAHYRAIGLSLLAHAGALVLVGGDWMALYRLMVPLVPGAVLVSAALAEVSTIGATLMRVGTGVVICMILFAKTGVRARHVGAQRIDLIRRAQSSLAGAKQVAALDVGWVGCATAVDITDLAGITDRSIARLPGGHTSKRVPRSLFEQREVDALVLLLAPGARLTRPWWASAFHRAVEQRVAGLLQADFEVRAELALGGTSQHYVVLRKRN